MICYQKNREQFNLLHNKELWVLLLNLPVTYLDDLHEIPVWAGRLCLVAAETLIIHISSKIVADQGSDILAIFFFFFPNSK